MLTLNIIGLFVLLLTLVYLYRRFLDKTAEKYNTDSFDEVQQYLLDEGAAGRQRDELAESKKPILWIHVPYEYNARHWLDFGSRSSFDLNQPYLYMTVRSVIKTCGESFKIVIIDDHTFGRLLPGWKIRVADLADPIKSNVRQLAMAKLLWRYGGVSVPISFLCFKDLAGMYHAGAGGEGGGMFVCQNLDSNVTSTTRLYYPDCRFMGCDKECSVMKEFIEFLELKISDDYTAQSAFLGDFDRWCQQQVQKKRVRLVPATDMGVRTVDGEPVTVEMLLGQDYVHFYSGMAGIWIPADTILKRRAYAWFARMSPAQILDSQFILAKYFVIALAPANASAQLEAFEATAGTVARPDWIGFWRVPLTNGTLNVWGPMPQNLGNNVPRAPNAGDLVRGRA